MDDIRCHVLSKGGSSVDDGPAYLEDVLRDICSEEIADTKLVEITMSLRLGGTRGREEVRVCSRYQLSLLNSSILCLQDAIVELQEWLVANKQDFVVVFELSDQPSTYLLCVKKAEAFSTYTDSSSTFSLPNCEKQGTNRVLARMTHSIMRRSMVGKLNLLPTCSCETVIIVLLAALVTGFIAITAIYMWMSVRQFDPTC